jgi:solute carrier family 25 carnitine/acylcarnitine transporter 20/29
MREGCTFGESQAKDIRFSLQKSTRAVLAEGGKKEEEKVYVFFFPLASLLCLRIKIQVISNSILTEISPFSSIMSASAEEQSAQVRRRFAGGCFGGFLQAASSHPLDTIKSRVQNGSYATIGQCVRATMAKEGVRGFYRGVTPPLCLSGVYNSILFSLNQIMTNLVTPADHPAGSPLPLWRIALGAELTAPLYCLCINPMEVVKVRLQVQSQEPGKRLYSGPLDCVAKTVKGGGIQALMRGYSATVGSRLVGLPFYFSSYHSAKRQLSPADGAEPAMWVPMVSGCCAGAAFWMSNYPLDLLKTKLQGSSGSTFVEVARSVFAADGVRGFYRGFSVCILRSLPANASVWVGVEYTTRWMKSNGW